MVQTIGGIPFGTQLDWLWAELQGPEKKTWQNFLTNPNLITPQDFATAFENTYERADGKHLEKRKGYAKEVFGAYNANKQNMLPNNVTTAVDYLTNKGMSLAQATGVVGNLMAESGFDLDPDAYNPSEGGLGAYGIAQWRGSRQKGLQDYYNRMQPQQTQEENNMQQQPNNLLSMLQGGASNIADLFIPKQFQRQQDENQLYSRGEQFAMALDPLIHPKFRAGAQIAENAKARKAFELEQGARTTTLATLQKLCSDGDEAACSVAKAVEAKALLPKEALTIYYRQKFAKPTKTATQKTGAQLNDELKAQGLVGSYDPKAIFNVFSTGDIKEVGVGDTIIGGQEKEAQKVMGNKLTNMFFDMVDEGNGARDALGQIGILRSIMMDPKFHTGSLTEGKMAATKLYAALGGNVENLDGVSQLETFDALSKELILAKMGGKLGAGFSDGDRFFVERQSPQLGNTKMGNLQILLINQIIEERKALLAQMAIEYANDPERKEKGLPPIDTEFLLALQKFGEENSIKDIYNERLRELDEFFN